MVFNLDLKIIILYKMRNLIKDKMNIIFLLNIKNQILYLKNKYIILFK